MSKKLTLLAAAAALMSSTAFGQSAVPPHRTCSSHDHMLAQEAADPAFRQNRQAIEAFTAQYAAQPSANKGAQVIYNVPVVVHVLYNNATSNISDAQINSQLAILNADFQMLNSDNTLVPAAFSSLKADCQINFCLAQRTPAGAASTGIIRKSTTKSSFSTSTDDAKYSSAGGDDAWDRTQYLNIWVVPGIDGGGILGYAQFPGGPAATDGVVIGNKFFGNTGTVTAPYNKGRTATHEVGHWMNLYHIWGDDGSACTGSDLVGDTPNQADENYGCPTFPSVSCSNGANGDMFMNYMDYTDDACMYMFSAGQKTRMHAVLATGGSRAGLNTSLGCTPPATTVCNAPASQSAGTVTSNSAAISWSAVSGAASYTLQYKTSAATTWNMASATITGTSYTLTGLAASTTYDYRVATNCSGSTSAYTTASSFTTTAATATCDAPTAPVVNAVAATSAVVSWTAPAGVASYTVFYKATAATAWTTVNGITTTSYTISGLTAATSYQWQVRTNCTNGATSSLISGPSFTTSAASTCSNNYESNNTLSTATIMATNSTLQSMIGTTTDKDFFRIVTTAAAPKLKVTLTTLPADYDVILYNSAGTQLAISQNGSTTGETITYNSSSAATYYVRVYGYGGVYTTSACYTLTNQTAATNFREATPAIADESKTALTFFPNPTRGDVSFDYFATDGGTASIQVVDQSGRVVSTAMLSLAEGANTAKFAVGQLPAGLYFVRFQAGNDVRSAKLMIQK